jgi:hypothetical protein
VQTLFAEPAASARNRKWHHDTVASPQPVFAPKLNDFPHELMAQNVAGLHRGDVTVIEVQI